MKFSQILFLSTLFFASQVYSSNTLSNALSLAQALVAANPGGGLTVAAPSSVPTNIISSAIGQPLNYLNLSWNFANGQPGDIILNVNDTSNSQVQAFLTAINTALAKGSVIIGTAVAPAGSGYQAAVAGFSVVNGAVGSAIPGATLIIPELYQYTRYANGSFSQKNNGQAIGAVSSTNNPVTSLWYVSAMGAAARATANTNINGVGNPATTQYILIQPNAKTPTGNSDIAAASLTSVTNYGALVALLGTAVPGLPANMPTSTASFESFATGQNYPSTMTITIGANGSPLSIAPTSLTGFNTVDWANGVTVVILGIDKNNMIARSFKDAQNIRVFYFSNGSKGLLIGSTANISVSNLTQSTYTINSNPPLTPAITSVQASYPLVFTLSAAGKSGMTAYTSAQNQKLVALPANSQTGIAQLYFSPMFNYTNDGQLIVPGVQNTFSELAISSSNMAKINNTYVIPNIKAQESQQALPYPNLQFTAVIALVANAQNPWFDATISVYYTSANQTTPAFIFSQSYKGASTAAASTFTSIYNLNNTQTILPNAGSSYIPEQLNFATTEVPGLAPKNGIYTFSIAFTAGSATTANAQNITIPNTALPSYTISLNGSTLSQLSTCITFSGQQGQNYYSNIAFNAAEIGQIINHIKNFPGQPIYIQIILLGVNTLTTIGGNITAYSSTGTAIVGHNENQLYSAGTSPTFKNTTTLLTSSLANFKIPATSVSLNYQVQPSSIWNATNPNDFSIPIVLYAPNTTPTPAPKLIQVQINP